jgi:ferredoxin
VEVCPVDCFYAGPKMLVISDECIDCGLCVPECPVNAIYAEEDLPEDQTVFTEFNLEWSKKWPSITRKEEAPHDAEEWKDQANKREQIKEELDQINRIDNPS